MRHCGLATRMRTGFLGSAGGCLAIFGGMVLLGGVTGNADDGQAASPVSVEEGFESLFDGKTLEGWQGDVKGYDAADGVLFSKPGTGGNLYTQDEYSDFVFRFEFRLTPGANNGIAVRAPLGKDAAYHGMEVQILDDTHEKYRGLKEYQFHGSVYGVVPAKRGHLKPVGEWNEQEVRIEGEQIRVTLNGTVIVDADLAKASDPKTIDGREHPGLERTTGYLGFCGHGDKVEFRNLRVKRLSSGQETSVNP